LLLILKGMNVRRVVKAVIPGQLFSVVEPYGHLLEAFVVHAINGFPARGLHVIGVTGTNGKTTTVFFVHRMLHEAGYKVGMMSTVAYAVGGDISPQMTHMTTQTVPVLVKRLKQMRAQGVDWLVLETTSQALAQNRVWGIPYSVAVFTNLTHEHLSYHKTFERYRCAKVKLFTMTNKNKRGLRTGVANADDPNSSFFTKSVKNSLTYGIKAGDMRATKIKLGTQDVSFRASIDKTEYHLRSQIPGTVNVYNAMAAACVGHILGLSATQIEHGIAALKQVEGRMTRIDEGQSFTVYVDYAHTPDSFERLFRDLKPHLQGRLIVVFGSLGGGDIAKRAIQGELAGRYANIVVLCEEDDRKENPDTILQNIAEGVKRAGKQRDKNLFLIHDRKEAIRFGLNQAKDRDTVLLLGKGHEKTIEHADGEHPWNEIDTAHKAIKRILK
jgi:UDP-N-acetylmuramoyl-L-alanyl-D-glutamate--2,6-diaminopimelate ligase